MSNKESNYKKFIIFLEMFQGRPHHLARFLLENGVINDEFLKKISDSSTLNKITDISLMKEEVYFKNINDMKKYYNSIVYDIEEDKGKKTKEEWVIEMNQKLQSSIESESYEESARLRDYMKKNNIPRD